MKSILSLFLIILLLGCTKDIQEDISKKILFEKPVKVNVTGYNGDLMEPFISRDGQYLFFNNRNDPQVNTNLFYASKINDSTFNFIGEIENVNSDKLDAVASTDSSNNLYFISLRNVNSFSTVYRTGFLSENNSTVEPVPGIEKTFNTGVYFDVDVSFDGNSILLSKGKYDENNLIESDLYIAEKINNSFQLSGQNILKNINTEEHLEYAACTSKDMLELFFTRVISSMPHIFVSTRNSKNEAFKQPIQIEVIEGFAEAPALSADGKILYYHKLDGDKFGLYMVRRINK